MKVELGDKGGRVIAGHLLLLQCEEASQLREARVLRQGGVVAERHCMNAQCTLVGLQRRGAGGRKCWRRGRREEVLKW